MQLDNLRYVAHHAATTISTNDLNARYTGLVNRLDTAVRSPGSNQPPAIRSEAEALLGVVRNEPPLTADQRSAWRTLGIDRVLGPSAAQTIEAAFTRHIGDPLSTAKELTALQEETLLVFRLCSRVAKNVDRLGSVPPAPTAPVLSIRCAHAVDARDLDDLEDRIGQWNMILKTLDKAAGVPETSPPLVTLERGSVLFGVLIDPQTWELLKLLAQVLVPALGTLKAYYVMRTELAKLQLPTDAVQTKIDKQTQEAERQAREALARARPASTPEDEARRGPAVTKLTLFLRDGGEFHYLPGPEGSDEETERVGQHLLRFYAERNQALGAQPDHGRLPSEGSHEPPEGS